jgi:hypothetical protein
MKEDRNHLIVMVIWILKEMKEKEEMLDLEVEVS